MILSAPTHFHLVLRRRLPLPPLPRFFFPLRSTLTLVASSPANPCATRVCVSSPPRALFLGLSNNPHISDLHLDISSSDVRRRPTLAHLLRRQPPLAILVTFHRPSVSPLTAEVRGCRCDPGAVPPGFLRGDFGRL